MTQISFGVVGFGHIGKKHAIMVDGNESSTLKVVVDADEAKRAGSESDVSRGCAL